jgi:predicted hydrocarbon binding protein
VFEHYLKRLSQRGWGQFRFQSADAKTGAAEIRLENSLFVLAQAAVTAQSAPRAAAAGTPPGTRCYMFAGWFAGAMDWVLDTSGVGVKTHSAELQCGGQGHSHCLFRVRPQI